MIIIGEKINGAIPAVGQAIARLDAACIRDLAIRQTEAGADYLDVCASGAPELERNVLAWLLEIVQDATDVPICLDSPNPEALRDVLPLVKRPGIINSVSGEGNKCEVIYPLAAESDWKIIVLTCDDGGVSADAEHKAAIGLRLLGKAEAYGIAPDRIFIDPLVLSLSVVGEALLSFTQTLRQIKANYPTVHFTSGLSNISFGMPKRKLINQNFLAFALEAGMDSAIMDPTDKVMRAEIFAAEAILGRDKFCRAYNKAYRRGALG
ncbi:MAG: methyltetrahydrofolate cobalamin methyltransferase [Desulfovibrio sp.]|jgi:5-methyltetrahydrofolate--homocysteine methyltransferase|nr:methyltetrahydrofolate cobalamin methyltransferase [Desulfovibrio sp.]